ncbi:MAG: MotA/TolQ/ExbB proton channel family protein [Kiritimatiellae bacterium]|nr:MotA/TolQ/ExbB proton channel family protein [Kiritimatiellia bacterium]
MELAANAVFLILIGLAVTAVAMFFGRFIELRRFLIDWQDFLKGVTNVLESGNEDEAIAICEDTPVPVANVVATAIRHRKGTALALREAVEARGRAEVSRLDRRLAALSMISHIAPLLGLLGTMIGFVDTVMIVDGGEIVLRSQLITSAVSAIRCAIMGLVVAIPVSVMYGMLRLRTERLIVELDAAATEIVGYILTKGARQ